MKEYRPDLKSTLKNTLLRRLWCIILYCCVLLSRRNNWFFLIVLKSNTASLDCTTRGVSRPCLAPKQVGVACRWSAGIKPLRSPPICCCFKLIAVAEALRVLRVLRCYRRQRHCNTITLERINVDTSGFLHLASEHFLHLFVGIYCCAKLI